MMTMMVIAMATKTRMMMLIMAMLEITIIVMMLVVMIVMMVMTTTTLFFLAHCQQGIQIQENNLPISFCFAEGAIILMRFHWQFSLRFQAVPPILDDDFISYDCQKKT